jgi:hypothetical protein
MNGYIEENIGFHNTLVRINNQIDFSLFGEVSAEGVVKGKDNFLYEYDYIRGYLGLDFTGERFIEEKMGRMKYIQEALKKEHGITLTLVLEPSKARFYPEKLPGQYKRSGEIKTNFSAYKKAAQKMGVNLIDFNQYFLSMEDTASYPLYPPYGIHWSLYGMSFCADSIINYIQHYWVQTLPKYDVRFYVSETPEKTDNDVEKALNLLFPLASPELAYPEYTFDTLHAAAKPYVLVIADSYYFNIFNTRIPRYIFNNEAFWYFNRRVYPEFYYDSTEVADLDIRTEIEKQDYIFLMITERFLHRFDWHFIDNLYDIYAPEFLRYPEYEYFNDILNNDDLFKKLVAQSQDEQVPLESLLWENAHFLFMENEWADFMMMYGLERQMEIIKNDTGWYNHIKEKASEQDIPVLQMLRKDAEYVFQQNYPELYRINEGINYKKAEIFMDQEYRPGVTSLMNKYYLPGWRAEEVYAKELYFEERVKQYEKTIRSDEEWLDHVRKKAKKNDLTLDEMIRIDAEYMLQQELEDLRSKM